MVVRRCGVVVESKASFGSERSQGLYVRMSGRTLRLMGEGASRRTHGSIGDDLTLSTSAS